MSTAIQGNERQHKRTGSSVLKSIIAPKHHKRNPSAGNALSHPRAEYPLSQMSVPILPPNHPHAQKPLEQLKLRERQSRSSSERSIEIFDEENKAGRGLHKRNECSRSLKSSAGKEKENVQKPKANKGNQKPKKSKSSTSLSALLSKSKSSKHSIEDEGNLKDKENQTPPNTASVEPPPIWAQFASQPVSSQASPTKVPLNDWKDVERECALYTPEEYSPSKQRNFQNYHPPTLSRRIEPKPRPRSAYVSLNYSAASFADTVYGLRNTDDAKKYSINSFGEQSMQPSRIEMSENRRSSPELGILNIGSSAVNRKVSEDSAPFGLTVAKSGSRVMAAVAALNGKSRESEKELPRAKPDVKDLDKEFESLLVSRNIPQHMWDGLRACDLRVKETFVKTNTNSILDPTSILGNQASMSQRPSSGQKLKTDDGTAPVPEEEKLDNRNPKKSRPRSRTFTFSKGDISPSKKQKHEQASTTGRPKSMDLSQASSSKSLTSAATAQALAFLRNVPKPAVPEDFISYLRKTPKPEEVEVGKLQKLRQLLRNETVGWVDTFITKGGMTEVIELLNRIFGVEWREEHEDALLHETLLCLKALCTTSLGLSQLTTVENTLFPSLLGLLFSTEKKGPAEFTTRNIIISLLFTHLSTSPRADRARTLLSYLHDPAPPEEARPPTFITSIYHPRPYRVWCKEIVNVTKEVFWIFLHHLNVVPHPQSNSRSFTPADNYLAKHFPRERPPVPAAPYVGGVEWDATNYLATHLDLLNGLIACLPTSEERNNLRQELKDSGLEKVMGSSFRICKEKFYGGVHAGLGTWVGAAWEDGWDVEEVRQGPRREALRSPRKVEVAQPPKLDMPKLNLDHGAGNESKEVQGWL